MTSATCGRLLASALLAVLLALAACTTVSPLPPPTLASADGRSALLLPGVAGPVRIDGLFYETAQGRSALPASLTGRTTNGVLVAEAAMPDGRTVTVTVRPDGRNYRVSLAASPATGITKWGFAVEAAPDEYYTGIMERVVDGPQQASWAPNLTAAMNLRGQKVDMVVKPTTSVYAPFYVSSKGYGLLVQTDWPGLYDFAASDPTRVGVAFEGPALAFKVYTAGTPVELVQAHALDSGPPILPPKWMYRPWRWRDEHTNRLTYYDGTPVTAPFNSEVLEDILMMRAYGIPTGVYWIDRPWSPGPLGWDDFEVDGRRLPNFVEQVKWLESQGTKTMLWIGPFFQGNMMREALAKGYDLPSQTKPTNPNGIANNYPMVDLSNPAAKAYWQSGVEKLLRMGVAGFKLDRGEENIPEGNTPTTANAKRFDGKSIRENRNTYVADYARAVAEVARKVRGDDFVSMPRGAYTGSSAHAVFWGGDIAGTPEGLRASIIAVQRSSVMGYPNWGSDTGGYNSQSMDSDLYARWLGFSAFNPIMEVGPTRNVGFWNLPAPHTPSYDAPVIAAWRLYARLHDRLVDYSHAQGQLAARTGMPIVRPLFLVEPGAAAAWSNWWTFQYGPDLLVSPIWEKGKREQQVYLPTGTKWRDAWQTDKVYDGGQTITVKTDLHQTPIFVRDGAPVAKALGDLNREWAESVAIAARRPDLKALDAEVKALFPTLQQSPERPYPAPAASAASLAAPGGVVPPAGGGAPAGVGRGGGRGGPPATPAP
jgi:alpha-glucosidase (family GH31 glycosyl hydrolase)